ncbi:MAG: hypothetical protein LBQ81_09665 [Zoogloeaceae bacterium]|jgi:hypothetical protein|nr:hypothetical protein [Zoogloeaceae bacterium]
MNDLIYVALIGAGSGLLGAFITQRLANKAELARSENQSRLQAVEWQRRETSRKAAAEEDRARETAAWERGEALRKSAARAAHLRELWGHVLTAHAQVLALQNQVLDQAPQRSLFASVATWPSAAAAQAYAVALIGLTDARVSAKAFYKATVKAQFALMASGGKPDGDLACEWRQAFRDLEDCVATLGGEF